MQSHAVALMAALGAAVVASWVVRIQRLPQPGPRDFSATPGGPMANALSSRKYRSAVAAVAAGHPAGCRCQICSLAAVTGHPDVTRVTQDVSSQHLW